MNIAYIITRSDNIGGAHVHIRDTALAMRARGHDARVFVGGEGPFTEELTRRGVPFHALKHLIRPIRPQRDLRGILELCQAFTKWSPDLVSTHSSKAGLLGRAAARSLGIPALFTAHGWAFTEGVPERERQLYISAERLAAPLAQRIITVSEHDRQLALRHRVASAQKLRTVHNGMPLIEARLLADASRQPPRLISVARFEEQKDHRTMLHALARLRELPWTLDLVGDGPLLPEMQQLAAALGLSERIHFLGARKDVAELLSQAQLFLLVTNWEGFPRSILEAMRAGLPVVASDVGGVREAVQEGLTGQLVGRGDGDALTRTLSSLLADPQLRGTLGQAGRARFLAEFTFERMLEKTLQVYEEALGGQAGRFQPALQ